MYLALFGCLFVLIIADGAALWHGFLVPEFLSAYLAVCLAISAQLTTYFRNIDHDKQPLCFLALWAGIKYQRKGSLHLKNLSNLVVAKESFRYLDEIGQRASMKNQPEEPRGWGNLWGLM